jgi:hypothetical protein
VLDENSEDELAYWRPLPGERLVGRVVGRLPITGKWGKRSALVVTDDDSGTQKTVVLTSVLANRFSDVASGWWVTMEYLGKAGSYMQWKTAKMSPEQAGKEEQSGRPQS